jgi:splicing factor 3B subunit 4
MFNVVHPQHHLTHSTDSFCLYLSAHLMDQVPYGGGVAFSQFMAGSNAAIAGIYERNQDATLYVANLDSKVDEEILWELFIQCAPLTSINLPRERISAAHQGYGFVEFKTPQDADYALRVMNMVKLYGKPIRLTKGSQGTKTTGPSSDVGANLFIGGRHT